MPLLNLKLPGFLAISWREQLKIWTLRNLRFNAWLHEKSEIAPIDRRSYNILLENAGFNSTEVYINLGLILVIPALIVSLMPLAWLADTFCTVKDAKNAKYGGRRPITRKPLL